MSKKLFIGVDLGTTYLKVGAYDLNGNILGYSSQELNLFNPKAGHFFQDPNEFYMKALCGIKKCIAEASLNPKDIKGIAFDGQSGGIMAIDYKFKPVIHYDIIIDDRAQEYSKLLNETHKDFIYKYTCCSSTYGEKIIYWSRNSEVSKNIHKFIQPVDFVSGRLCGLKGDDAFMGFSYLCWSGLCDARTLSWEQNICDKFDVMDKMSLIKIPCLIICGKDDKLTPPKYAMYFNDKIEVSELVLIDEAGHIVMLEKPKEVNQAIKEFIKKYLEA